MTDYTKLYGPLNLRKGSGGDYANGLCLMEAVAWMASEGATDSPECACPVLAAFAVELNDGLSDENRQLLKPLILPMTGTRSEVHEKARAKYLVLAVANRILPQALEASWPDHARALRAATTLAEVKTAAHAAKAASEASATYAVSAATAAAYGASAAKAAASDASDALAVSAATAATYAAYAAAHAAYAATYAARAANAAAAYAASAAHAATAASADVCADHQKVFIQCIEILREAIMLGPNASDFWSHYEPRARALAEHAETLNA